MAAPFVWFDDAGEAAFYRDLFGGGVGPAIGDYEAWITDGERPWAGVVRAAGAAGSAGRVPYVAVEDLAAAAERAVALGGRIVRAQQDGPAGAPILVADPAAAVVALFVPAAR